MAASSSSNPPSKINLLELAAAALSSVVVAADQIASFCSKPELDDKDDDANNKMNIRLKNDGSIVTDADIAAQSIIFQALRNVSEDVKLLGEESPEEVAGNQITGHEERSETMFRLAKEEILIRYNRSDDKDVPLPLAQSTTTGQTESGTSTDNDDDEPSHVAAPLSRLEECDVDADRVTVVVDPLDGTNAYSKGDYGPVSILIAIVLDGIPCFGVICKPFGYPGYSKILDTSCVAFYGGTLLGTVYTAGGTICSLKPLVSKKNGSAINALPRAVISSSKSKGVVQQVVSQLGNMGIIDPEPMMVTGAGEKSLRVILRSQNEGLWFYPKPGTSIWDVAASDAILRTIGGRLTDGKGNDINYNRSRHEARNMNGVVACYDKSIHETCMRLYLEGTWDD